MHLTHVTLDCVLALAPASGDGLRYAYLDLGTGSMLIQLIAASALSIAVMFKNIRMAVTGFFQRLVGKKATELPARDSSPTSDPQR